MIAQEEARTLAHAHVGSQHILLGLLRERDGLAGQVLSDLGIDVETVYTQVAPMAHAVTGDMPQRIPFAAGAKVVLEHALRESLQLGHDFIGTEHLLLGLLCVTNASGAEILQRAGVSYETVRVEIAQRAPGAWRTQSAGAARDRAWTGPREHPRDSREAMLQGVARRFPGIDRSSVHVLKERARKDRWLYAVEFEDQRQEQQLWLAEVERAEDGSWHSRSGGGGPRPAPRVDDRWIYLEGWSSEGSFCLGGELLIDSADACEARLTLADGTEFMDDLANGVVLFGADRPLGAEQALVSVYNSQGVQIASHSAF